MRRLTISVLFLAAGLVLCAAAKDESIDELKARFEKARTEERAELGIHIARLQLQNADALYRDGKTEPARAAVDEIVSYSEKARDAAIQANKRLKSAEIEVRKMADKLRDIKRNLAFEDQPPVDQAIRRLEDVRTALLQAMFGKDSKREKKK